MVEVTRLVFAFLFFGASVWRLFALEPLLL